MMWKGVVEYIGIYEVSDTGLVRGIDRFIDVVGGTKRFITGKILKPKINNDGYATLSLVKDGIKTYFYVHRLIGCAFLPNPDNLPEINHLSGNKLCNNVENLQWVSHSTNVKHAYDNGLNNNQHGQHHKAVCIIDNYLGTVYETIKDWCKARNITYSYGKNILCGSRVSKNIDLSQIIRIKRSEEMSIAA